MSVNKKQIIGPEHTATRVALWRALHLKIDPAPHVFNDSVGAQLVGEPQWEDRPDMNPQFCKPMRASIVGRARFVEDLLEEAVSKGLRQYIILGAGLDTLAQRRGDLTSRLNIYEIDQPGPQQWKQLRLAQEGYLIPKNLHFVPVDFEAGESWWSQLLMHGFDATAPAMVVSTGVSMYLSKSTNQDLLNQVAKMAQGTLLAMTYMLVLDLLDQQERASLEFVMNKAKDSGTPFLSLFSPQEIVRLAKQAGFVDVENVSGEDIYLKYFSQRTDGLRAGHAEAFLIARN